MTAKPAISEEIALPVITKPLLLSEGTQTELSDIQIAEILPWALDSKVFLTDLLLSIQWLNTEDKIERLVEGIKSVVAFSSPKNTELLMRYTLNRGLVLNEVIKKETQTDAVGTSDTKLRLLISTIKMAIQYYDMDLEVLNKKTSVSYIAFGIKYFNFLNELNKSIFDASAQFMIQRIALEWLQWDLYRDLKNIHFASQIVKINNSLKTISTKKTTDIQALALIRQMKAISQQLKLDETQYRLLWDEHNRITAIKNKEKELEQQAKDQLLKEQFEKAKLKIGEQVIWNNHWDNHYATVLAIQENGDYVLKSDKNEMVSNIKRSDISTTSGCYQNFCVNEIVLLKLYTYSRGQTHNDWESVMIVGISFNGNYIIKTVLEDGSFNYLADRTNLDFGKTSGCGSEGLCVKNKMISTLENVNVEIVALLSKNKYLILYTSGNHKGQMNDYDPHYLVKDSSIEK
jgi:hypothetical protein